MKRAGGLFEQVASFENLYEAYRKARRGKRGRASVDRFSFELEAELLSLRRNLLAGSYRPGPLVAFTVEDPKRRRIQASPFRDRVLHHAILNVTEPIFERTLDPDAYACRRGKGLDAALARAVELSRRAGWVLKTDVEKFFASVDHGVLKGLLERRFKDRRLLELFGRIIDHGGAAGKGLPIGSLTSQWLANLYLDPLDRWVRSSLRPAGYIRYMDDVAVLSPERGRLRGALREMRTWLREALHLDLKLEVTQIHSTARGWPFLGFRVTPAGLRVRRRTWRLWKARFQAAYHEYRLGRRTLEDLVRSSECRLAHLERARSASIRRKELRWIEI